jgi:hypothetical protein
MRIATRLPTRTTAFAVAALVALSISPSLGVASAEVPPSLRSAIPTVKRWLANLEEGRARKAWALMAQPTRRAIGGFDEFKDEKSAWAEGWGAWASARDRDFTLDVVAPMDEDAASVVTITGRVAREGPFQSAVAALPVQTVNGRTEVDPIHGNAVIRSGHPLPEGTINRRPIFQATIQGIRARNTSVTFSVKGSRVGPQRADLTKIGRRKYLANVKWPGRLSEKRHVLTITAWGSGDFKSEALRFRVKTGGCGC